MNKVVINNPQLLLIVRLLRPIKWGQLKELHAAIKLCSTTFQLGQQQEVMCQKSLCFLIYH